MTLCVGAVVLRDRRVLFVRQASGRLKGQWSLPWGFVEGKRPDGILDLPEDAAIRETREEAGVLAQVEGLLGIQNHESEDGEPRLYLLFLCRHISGEPTPDQHETDGAAFLSLEEMDKFDEPFDTFCEWMARRVLLDDYNLILPEESNPYQPHLAFF
jgi:ADP-ribose pyrophosphatase YjhB (NUDIX family)